jgi:tetratricopeptide (TPR) repeat protein
MRNPFRLLLFIFILSAQQGLAQKTDSIKIILDFWQHDSEWSKAPYDSLAKEMQNGISIDKYQYYQKLKPLIKQGDSKLMLYYKMSKLLTERSLSKKNAQELKDAALQLLPLAIKEESVFAQSWYYEHLGDFCLRAGELEKAVYYLLLTVDLHEQIGLDHYARQSVTNVYFVAGRALLQTREYKRSLIYIQKALNSLDATPVASVTPKYRTNSYIMLQDLMGSNYKKIGKYAESLNHYEKILKWISDRKLDTNARYNFWKGLTYGNIGQVLLAQGKLKEAQPLLEKGLEASIAYDDGGNTCEFYENIARVNLLLGNYNEAINAGLTASKYLNKLIYPDKIASDIYDVLNKAYLKLNRYETALQYLNLYHKHKDNYQQLLENSQLKKIEVELDYSKIQQQNAARAAEIGRLTWLRNTLIALVVLVLIISVLIYRNHKLKQDKKLKAIALEQDRAEQEVKVALQQIDQFKQNIIEKDDLIQALEVKAEAIWRSSEDVPENLKNFTLITEEGWNKFRMDFIKAYPKFLPTLRANHKELSTAEERLAMLIFLKLDNNKIANSLSISRESVGKAKRRLRANLGFDNNQSLEDYIITIV